jgi:hypothetical protein
MPSPVRCAAIALSRCDGSAGPTTMSFTSSQTAIAISVVQVYGIARAALRARPRKNATECRESVCRSSQSTLNRLSYSCTGYSCTGPKPAGGTRPRQRHWSSVRNSCPVSTRVAGLRSTTHWQVCQSRLHKDRFGCSGTPSTSEGRAREAYRRCVRSSPRNRRAQRPERSGFCAFRIPYQRIRFE